MQIKFKSIKSILPPLFIIILGFLVSKHYDAFSEQQLSILYYTPYVILTLASAIAWRFNRSRAFFISIILILSYFTTNYPGKSTAVSNHIYLILCILLPFNIIVFTILKERGIISIWGMFRFGLILMQIWLVYWVIATKQLELINKISSLELPVSFKSAINLTQLAVLVFLLSIIVLIVRIKLYRAITDISFLFIILAMLYMLNGNRTYDYSICYSMIGLIIIILILRETYVMAFYDELTGIPSRRALNQDLMKLGMKYTIAMLDIDFFKKFNDTYGHETGDEVLKFIASMIHDVKGGGKAYRYGGEEFTILFPGKSMNDVIPTLEELRETIAGRGFYVRKKRSVKSKSNKNTRSNISKRNSNADQTKKISIHVSIGVAVKDDNNKTTAMVLKAADAALYRAKKKGRNCVSK